MKLVWTANARHQLLSIVAYIAQDAPDRALAYGHKIEAATRKLSRFHRAGRIVPEMAEESPDLREILIDDYRLVYKIFSRHILIISLFHGRRRFPL